MLVVVYIYNERICQTKQFVIGVQVLAPAFCELFSSRILSVVYIIYLGKHECVSINRYGSAFTKKIVLILKYRLVAYKKLRKNSWIF